jgi:hypothetical protein
MASVRFTDVQARPTEFLDFTSLTLEEFQTLIPPFEAAFHAHMAVWRLDGKPRTTRQFAVYKTCPLPTPQDRLFFILVYLKTGFDHGVGHPLLLLGDAKAPNCRKNKAFNDLGHYAEWPKVADAVIKASKPMRSRWYTDVCLAWAKAKRISGFTSSSPPSSRRYAPSAMPQPAP